MANRGSRLGGAAMRQNTDRSAIYASVLKSCGRFKFIDHWRRFQPDVNAFLAPKDSAATLEALKSEFGEDALIASRVAIRDNQGKCHLSAGLQPGRILVGFGRGERAERIDLLTAAGCLSGELPLLAAQNDNWTSAALAASADHKPTLFVAFSIGDVAALRALGLAATLACRPERVRPQKLAFLNSSDIRVVVLGWSPLVLTRSVSTAFRDFCAHIAGLETHLNAMIGDWSVWRPDDSAVESIRFALRCGERDDVRDQFLDVVDHYRPSAVVDGSIDVRPPEDEPGSLEEAWGNLRQLPDRSGYDLLVGVDAWKEYERRLDGEIITPLMRAARAEPDLQRRDLLLATAEITRIRHHVAVRISNDLLQLPHAPEGAWRSQLPVREIQVLLALTGQSVALLRELQRGKEQGRGWGSRWWRGRPK